ncbi:hypothetical protein G646_gp024 [Serratia phage phiMAM1]|uniref:Uncharacterized protein n=1 Tax=Serratia phage phiMAM1 TaxID=1262513 RepID=K7YAZ7_9CAUD|nr:hypothetical protein G646_gp024 [Serratia phage phiMAM1]AFX93492.1 hypothetical protein MAM_024 [Serratia phage phiMAM1]
MLLIASCICFFIAGGWCALAFPRLFVNPKKTNLKLYCIIFGGYSAYVVARSPENAAENLNGIMLAFADGNKKIFVEGSTLEKFGDS